MWRSKRLESISLESWQRKAQAWRRDRARIRPIVTLLEERALLSLYATLMVNTLTDDPRGSIPGYTTLRDAITQANTGTTTNLYVIIFAVEGTIEDERV